MSEGHGTRFRGPFFLLGAGENYSGENYSGSRRHGMNIPSINFRAVIPRESREPRLRSV